MEPLNNLLYEEWNLSDFEDRLLCFCLSEDMIKFERLEFTHILCLIE